MNHVARQLLHSENFELCRICLLEPESNSDVAFFPIFGNDGRCEILRHKIFEILRLKIERNDVKPKVICGTCHELVLYWYSVMRKTKKTSVVIDFIAKTRFKNSTTVNQVTTYVGSLSDSMNNDVSTAASKLPSYPQTKLQLPQSETRPVSQPNSYTSSSQQDRSTVQPFIANNSTPVETHESDDNSSCYEVPIPDEVICVSSDSEVYEVNFKQNPSGVDVVRYCSICKVYKKYNHDCSSYNKEFSTCLVPNCYRLFRTLKDFDQHYRQHIGFSQRKWMCRCCFRERKKINGRHICYNIENVFMCHACDIVFSSMAELAWHNRQIHNGQLMNSIGNLLCFYCEISSPNNMYIKKHAKEMHYKKNKIDQENEAYCETKHKELKASETTINGQVIRKTNDPYRNVNNVKSTYKLLFFNCLKKSCNLVFANFQYFKFHHRQHFNTGKSVMCWQCCKPFNSATSLRFHQRNDNCRTPGMFKCFECPEVFDDIECFSVHKYIVHNGQLVIQKRSLIKNTVMCPSCRSAISTDDFRSHLIQCYTRNIKSSNETSCLDIFVSQEESNCTSYTCGICGKDCLSNAALSTHMKFHNINQTKIFKRKEVNSNNCDLGFMDTNDFSSKNNRSSNSNLNKTSPNNYYCTDCEKYFLPLDFGSHFKIAHGKKLELNINKQFFCSKCPFKFIYKVALLMHYQHVHTELENTERNTTGIDDSIASLASDDTGESIEEIEIVHDQRMKEEIDDTMCSDVQYDGLGSLIHGEYNNQGDTNTNEELFNGDMSNVQSVNHNLKMEEEQHDSGSVLEIDNTYKIERNTGACDLGGKCMEPGKLNRDHEVNWLEKNNESSKLGAKREANNLDENNEANCKEESGNIEMTMTSNDNIHNMIVVKKEFI